MAPYRSAALCTSALSPQEYDEYIPRLSHAFDASFVAQSGGATELRLPPVEVWQWLTQWIDTVEERREKEILSFFRLPSSTTSTSSSPSTDYPPALQTLLALTRLYSHSKETRHLTRDLLFVQTDPVAWKVEPRASPMPSVEKGKGREKEGEGIAEPHPPPPIRTASLVGKPTPSTTSTTTLPALANPFRRPPPLATTTSSTPIADLGLPTPPSSTTSFPPGVTGSGSALQRAVSNPTVREREPPMPPPKRIPPPVGQPVEGAGAGAAAGPGLKRASTNPFRRSEDAGEGGRGPVSEGGASSSTSSGGKGPTSLPPLPPRPLSTPASSKPPPPPTPAPKPKPPLPPSSASKPLPPRRSSKPALPQRRASLPAPSFSSSSTTAPRLSIISSSSSSHAPPASAAAATQPIPPPLLPSRDRLTSSTHIGIGSSVRLISTTRHSLSHHSLSQGESKEHSPAHSNAGSGGGVKGRKSRSNSGVSAVEGDEGGFNYGRTSPRKEGKRELSGSGGRGRSGSGSGAWSQRERERKEKERKESKQSPFVDSPSLSRSRSRSPSTSSNSSTSSASYADPSQSARTAPLPSTSRFPSSTFPSFTTASVIPPLPSEEADTLYGAPSLARSSTLGSKPKARGVVPPPPKRRVPSSTGDNPFDPLPSLGIGRPPHSASPSTTTQQAHRRTTSLTSRHSSASAPASSGIGAEVVGFLKEGAREGEGWLERAREGLGRRASGRKGAVGEEGERLVEGERESSSEEEGEGVGEEEMKDLERSVRERVERGQWRVLGE